MAAILRKKGAQYMRDNSDKHLEPERQRKAAMKIQRWYRELVAMYAAFGPMLFSCKDGRMADFGHVSYLSGSRTAKV
jgi:hypothetical protein